MDDSAFPTEQGEGRAMNGELLTPGLIRGGLTKRELLAAMAMQGYCSISHSVDNPALKKGRDFFIAVLAEQAVAQADALLARLAKSPDGFAKDGG